MLTGQLYGGTGVRRFRLSPFSANKQLIQRTGGVEDGEVFRAFNMGAGIIVAIDDADATRLIETVSGAWRIGEIVTRDADEPAVQGLPD